MARSGSIVKGMVGIVSSDKMDKTITVMVERLTLHPIVHKYVRRRSKFKAHDSENSAKLGDVVRILPSKPVSKTKCWKLAEIIQSSN